MKDATILAYLTSNGPSMSRDIAATEGLRGVDIGHLLKAMSHRGLIEFRRVRKPGSNRIWALKATLPEREIKRRAPVDPKKHEFAKAILSAFGPCETNALASSVGAPRVWASSCLWRLKGRGQSNVMVGYKRSFNGGKNAIWWSK
jgi:DNA-binding MarR family transcriptional regulator